MLLVNPPVFQDPQQDTMTGFHVNFSTWNFRYFPLIVGYFVTKLHRKAREKGAQKSTGNNSAVQWRWRLRLQISVTRCRRTCADELRMKQGTNLRRKSLRKRACTLLMSPVQNCNGSSTEPNTGEDRTFRKTREGCSCRF